MLCYLLHKTPIWHNVPDGKRNIRILCLALVLYLFLHAIAREFKDTNFFAKFVHGYFIFFIVADIFLCGIEYKMYYGRSIIKELGPYEKDIYDESTHTYIPDTFGTVNMDMNMDNVVDMDIMDMNMDNNMDQHV